MIEGLKLIGWDDLGEMVSYGVLLLPTVLLAFWHRSRRVALFPLALVLFLLSPWVAYGMGSYLHYLATSPHAFACGNGFFLPLEGLLGLAGWTLFTGAAFLVPTTLRPLGRTILVRMLPIFAVASVLAGLAGRYLGR